MKWGERDLLEKLRKQLLQLDALNRRVRDREGATTLLQLRHMDQINERVTTAMRDIDKLEKML